jgi:hypothetical protein
MLHDLRRNICTQIMGTLEAFSLESAQLDYKRKVPFVHVPEELLAQWGSYRNHFYDSNWFSRWLDPSCLTALICLDEKIQQFSKDHRDIEDVPIIFDSVDWKRIGVYSRDILQTHRGALVDFKGSFS